MTQLLFEDHETIDYLEAWELQKRVHAEVVEGARTGTVLLLEHPPTYTAGKRTDDHERPLDSGGAPVIDVDRGGKITFHGPGQLVAYPIVRLPDHVKVVDFVRRLEEAMFHTCADLGVTTARVPGRSEATALEWSPSAPTVNRRWSSVGTSESEYGCEVRMWPGARNRTRKNCPARGAIRSSRRPFSHTLVARPPSSTTATTRTPSVKWRASGSTTRHQMTVQAVAP